MIDQPRFKLHEMPQDAYRHLLELEALISDRLDPTLYHLVKMRASQINGCAFCLEMHADRAIHDGERPERLIALDAWRESTLYSEHERAALAWTEDVTLIADLRASTSAFEALKKHFDDEEIRWLIFAVVQINSWNRIAIATRAQYDAKLFARDAAHA